MRASGPPETMTLIHPNTHPFILHATWQKRSENGQKCGHDFADHAQSTHQPDSDQRTMFKQDTPHIKKKGRSRVWCPSDYGPSGNSCARPPPALRPSACVRSLPDVTFLTSALSQSRNRAEPGCNIWSYNSLSDNLNIYYRYIVLTKTKTPIHFHKQIQKDTRCRHLQLTGTQAVR